MPYLLSTLDTLARRYNVPRCNPEAVIPGMREIGGRTTLNLWGNVYRAAASCIRPTTTRAAPSSRSARAMSSRGACSRTSTSRCSRVRATAGRPAPRGERCLHRQVAGADADPLQLLRRVPTPTRACRPSKATTPGRCGGLCLLPAPRAGLPRQRRFPLRYSDESVSLPFRTARQPYALSIALACAVTAAAGVAWAQTRISPTGVGVSGSVIGDDVLYSIGGGRRRVHGRRREHAEHRRGHRLEQQPDLRKHEHHDDAAEPVERLTNGLRRSCPR